MVRSASRSAADNGRNVCQPPGCPGHHRDAVVMWGRGEERIIVLQRDRALVLGPLRPKPLQLPDADAGRSGSVARR